MLKDPILQTKIKTYHARENRKNKKQNQRFCNVHNLIYIPNKSNSKIKNKNLKYKKNKLLTNDKLDMKQYDEGPLSNGKTKYSQIKKSIR